MVNVYYQHQTLHIIKSIWKSTSFTVLIQLEKIQRYTHMMDLSIFKKSIETIRYK